MIAPQLLRTLFFDNHTKIKEATANLTHEESIQNPSFGGNCIHWIVGHLVVARCNFLTLLDVPSIWDWPTCKLFVPGSSPTVEAADHLRFSSMLADLDRTQSQLLASLTDFADLADLNRSKTSDLAVTKEDKSIGEQLTEYAAHEAYHAGQLSILRQTLVK